MNIFVVNKDPHIAAQELCDQHVVKMIVETAQMLCTAHWTITGGCPGLKPYEPTHVNHPCNKWVRERSANYQWLWLHGMELCREYTRRYDKIHKTQDLMMCLRTVPEFNPGPMTPHVICIKMSDPVLSYMCTIPGDPVRSYRLFYNLDKVRFARWRHSEKPSWLWKNNLLDYT